MKTSREALFNRRPKACAGKYTNAATDTHVRRNASKLSCTLSPTASLTIGTSPSSCWFLGLRRLRAACS